VQQALQKAGHTSDIEAFGEAALQRLFETKITYDLIVLDVGLPDLSGFEICRRVRGRY
jgi:DNA-binding response OmpR family regulator